MKPLVVLADDLTGAAEIGGIGAEYGLETIVSRGALHGEAELVVFDTDSRGLSALAAAERLEQVYWGWMPAASEVIFKKVDSVMRGPIHSELTVVMYRESMGRILLAPQNPSKGRVITRRGIYEIQGVPLDQTTFRDDPHYPRKTSRVLDLLEEPPGWEVSLGLVGQGTLEKCGVVICAAETVEELAQWAARAESRPVCAGGADMFRLVLEARGRKRVQRAVALPDQPTLVVCGSAADYSRNMVGAWGASGMAVIDVAEGIDGSTAGVEQAAGVVVAALEGRGRAILAIRTTVTPERAGEFCERTAAVVHGVLGKLGGRPLNLLIEGGATAGAIMEKERWDRFGMIGNVAAGVVAMEPSAAEHVLVVMKPGSYPWGERVLRVVGG